MSTGRGWHIDPLNLTDERIAARVLEIQRTGYRIEADLIGFDGIPPLTETLDELRGLPIRFFGYFLPMTDSDVLTGVIAVEANGDTLDIDRLVVHPDYFRSGIASALLTYVESVVAPATGAVRLTVSTGAGNLPARWLYERHEFLYSSETTVADNVQVAHYAKKLTNATA